MKLTLLLSFCSPEPAQWTTRDLACVKWWCCSCDSVVACWLLPRENLREKELDYDPFPLPIRCTTMVGGC